MYNEATLQQAKQGVVAAFGKTHDGFSADRVVADPELNAAFVQACGELGLAGDARMWNSLLFRERKAGRLSQFSTARTTNMSWAECEEYFFASEIALQTMLQAGHESLDAILCDPQLALKFDQTASQFAPGRKPLEYRWAALKLRKQAKLARTVASKLTVPARMGAAAPIDELNWQKVPDKAGVYLISYQEATHLYVGEALNLRGHLRATFGPGERGLAWQQYADRLRIQTVVTSAERPEKLAYQSCFAQKFEPRLNFQELWTSC